MQSKRERQATLLRLTREERLTSQEEMVRRLRERGVIATQASVSRDARELGLVRVGGHYVPATQLVAETDTEGASTHDELIISIEPVGANLLVLKTPVGAASAVAVDLDKHAWPEVIGTVAGDDTIFIAVLSRAAQGRVLARLRPRPRPTVN